MCLTLQSKIQVTKLNCSQLLRRVSQCPPAQPLPSVGLCHQPLLMASNTPLPSFYIGLSHQGGFSHCHLNPSCLGENGPNASRIQPKTTVSGVNILKPCGQSGAPGSSPSFPREKTGQGQGGRCMVSLTYSGRMLALAMPTLHYLQTGDRDQIYSVQAVGKSATVCW